MFRVKTFEANLGILNKSALFFLSLTEKQGVFDFGLRILDHGLNEEISDYQDFVRLPHFRHCRYGGLSYSNAV